MATVPARGVDGSVRASALKDWLLWGQVKEVPGPHPTEGRHPSHPWWKVMCLTGVDYFSTLGYQPGIAALAAGSLAPLATLVLVLVTLFGALPMYRWVAGESPHGDGSISMLERLLPGWPGKLFVLCLIGFVATGFVITITLSAADAAAHVAQNPFTRFLHGYEIPVTLFLIVLLGSVFLKGFGEAIGVAVALVAVYIALNLVVLVVGLRELVLHPQTLPAWRDALFQAHSSPIGMIAAAFLLFPRLALGLSGFETGVVVMPLVRGAPGDRPDRPAGRIRNARRLLTTAAALMSLLLLSSSLVTILLIPPAEFEEGGQAYGRALAYLAHALLGEGFGTAYDVSTILILWFAGASAMAGLLNIVPRYLPRYGMAPEWAGATRPLVLIFTTTCVVVTLIFRANVEAQAGAYATGVLALMTSASIAVILSARRQKRAAAAAWFTLVALVFIYTSAITVVQRPEGLQIAGCFIVAIVVTSVVSRLWRVTELRVASVEMDQSALQFVEEWSRGRALRIIASDPDQPDAGDYALKEQKHRRRAEIPMEEPFLFLEIVVSDPSEFAHVLRISGVEVDGFRILRGRSAAVPNAIAALLLHLRDRTSIVPHAYFSWAEAAPLQQFVEFLIFGEGDIAPVTHEVLRSAERDPARRPVIHVA
jgi:amino acid permease-like protein